MAQDQLRERWKSQPYQDQILPLISSELTRGLVVLNDLDLAGITIGQEGPVKEFWNINLYRACLVDVDLRYASLAGSISEARLTRVCLAQATLDACTLIRAMVTQCDFSGAKLLLIADDAVFENCDFTGAAFKSRRSNEFGGRRVRFSECNFTDAKFHRAEFRASRFVDCNFTNTKFVGCDFRGVKVEGSTTAFIDQFENMDPPPWAESRP